MVRIYIPSVSAVVLARNDTDQSHDVEMLLNRWMREVDSEDKEREVRTNVIKLIKECIAGEKVSLDFRKLSLSSMPPVFPINAQLMVSAEFLPALINSRPTDTYTDSFIDDYVDNFLSYHFEPALDNELNDDHNDFFKSLFTFPAANWEDVSALVGELFLENKHVILANTKDGLTRCMKNEFFAREDDKFSALQSELKQIVHGGFCDAASVAPLS